MNKICCTIISNIYPIITVFVVLFKTIHNTRSNVIQLHNTSRNFSLRLKSDLLNYKLIIELHMFHRYIQFTFTFSLVGTRTCILNHYHCIFRNGQLSQSDI